MLGPGLPFLAKATAFRLALSRKARFN